MWRERQTIEKNSLGSVVGIVTCGELGAFECLGTDVEGLTTEDTAVRARVLGDAVTTSSAGSNGVEGVAAKELLEREHEERETVERRVAVHRGDALVAVALDALVDAQQLEVPVHVLALVERAQDVRERRRVLASADCHCNSLARRQKCICADARQHTVLDPAHKTFAATYFTVRATHCPSPTLACRANTRFSSHWYITHSVFFFFTQFFFAITKQQKQNIFTPHEKEDL